MKSLARDPARPKEKTKHTPRGAASPQGGWAEASCEAAGLPTEVLGSYVYKCIHLLCISVLIYVNISICGLYRVCNVRLTGAVGLQGL